MKLAAFLLVPATITALSNNPFLDSKGGNNDNNNAQTVLQAGLSNPAVGFASPDKCTVGDGCDNTFFSIDAINSNIRPQIASLVHTEFFRYFKLQLYKSCPFWPENPMCFSPSCAVEVEPDSNDSWSRNYIPISDAKGNHSSAKTIVEYNCDYCDTAEESREDAVYLDLSLHPERYSGYGGQEAGRIWQAIYSENCFNKVPEIFTRKSQEKSQPRFSGKYLNLIVDKLQQIFNINQRQKIFAEKSNNDQCLEKRVFYRLVSGMHASIASHLSFQWLDSSKKDAQFEPNLNLFMQRVGYHADRISNIYFNYALLTKAILKLSEHLNQIQFSSSNEEKQLLTSIINSAKPYEESLFNEAALFSYEDDLSNQYLKNEFKANFANVSRLMDCVGCERCRLWGKVQTLGYGTALKVLFELNNHHRNDAGAEFDVKSLKRSELVALINTFDRISKSVEIINHFRKEHFKLIAEGASQKDDGYVTKEGDQGSSKKYRDANEQLILYQQKIFKGAYSAEEAQEKSRQNFLKEQEDAEHDGSYPASIKEKNLGDSKKQLQKIFKQKKPSHLSKPQSPPNNLIAYDSGPEDVDDDDLDLTKEEKQYRKIFRNSIRLKQSKKFEDKVFKDHILEVVEEFKDVFRFLWDSYVSFPQNVHKIIMGRVEMYWNYFIGNENWFLERKRELHRLDVRG